MYSANAPDYFILHRRAHHPRRRQRCVTRLRRAQAQVIHDAGGRPQLDVITDSIPASPSPVYDLPSRGIDATLLFHLYDGTGRATGAARPGTAAPPSIRGGEHYTSRRLRSLLAWRRPLAASNLRCDHVSPSPGPLESASVLLFSVFFQEECRQRRLTSTSRRRRPQFGSTAQP